jgi:hypothetical protein
VLDLVGIDLGTITVLNPVTGKPVTITLPKGDQAEAVVVVGLAFRIDDSDVGDALPGPLAGEAKRHRLAAYLIDAAQPVI